MAKAKYFTQNNEKVYPISHTKAVYDGNGKVLEDRLTEDETAISSLQTDVKGKADKTDVGNKLNSNSAISDTTVAFTEASERENIVSNEKSSTLFGKVQKWFSDLKMVAFTGSYSDLIDTPSNPIFVVCDGDHDELKLQAAIDSAPPHNSVIYPVGTQCVLTNENTIRGYGLPESSGRAVISLKSGITLDGSMCDDFVFKNTNPVAKQYIFHMTQSTTMKNVVFHEDTETVTADTVNPTVLSVGSESKIVSCTFYNIFSTHQFGVSTFEMDDVLFVDNIIDTFAGAPANNLTKEIKITGNSFVMGNEFWDFTQKEQTLGYMLQAPTVIFVNNYMSGFTNCSIDIGKKIVGNIFKTFTDCSIRLNGEFADNEFTTITQNTKTPFISAAGITLISGNRMSVIKINAEYIDFIECGNYAVICGNYMQIAASPASGQCNLITASSQTLIADNIFRTTASVTANADFSIIYSDGKTVVKNNVTNATSIGTFGDTCVVDGNVTGW